MKPLLVQVVLGVVLIGVGSGCVRRTILITSSPPGALVALNDQEVGRTPVEVDFLYYGDYQVRLLHEGYEPVAAVGRARPPLWDNIPVDLVAEAIPGERTVQIHWHYDLVEADDDPAGVLARAQHLRRRAESEIPLPESVSSPEEAESEVDSLEETVDSDE